MCLANEIEWSNIDGALPQTKSPHLEAQDKEPNWCLRGIASHLSLTLNMIKTPKDNGGFIDQKFSRPPASTIRLACPYRYKHAGSWLLPKHCAALVNNVFPWLFSPSSTKKLMIGSETNLPSTSKLQWPHVCAKFGIRFFFSVRESINIELSFFIISIVTAT